MGDSLIGTVIKVGIFIALVNGGWQLFSSDDVKNTAEKTVTEVVKSDDIKESVKDIKKEVTNIIDNVKKIRDKYKREKPEKEENVIVKYEEKKETSKESNGDDPYGDPKDVY